MRFPIPFTKMSGSGNDFIVIDHREPFIHRDQLASFTTAICQRKFSAGADGLILIENSDEADFAWTFLNADGSFAEMCGNGARCAARFAYLNNIAPASMRFKTLAGIIEAEIIDDHVKLKMTAPEGLELNKTLTVDGTEQQVHSLNTGVPHAVIFTDDARNTPVVAWGRTIRQHDHFQPAGTNANFVQVLGEKELHVRTYERGVEDETMACGTGAVAAAIIAVLIGKVKPPVKVITSGGEPLVIHFAEPTAGQTVEEVYLEGAARVIYHGQLNEEALGS
ncbi:MAG: diaminopimelate epimerase [Desulfobulbaceae bacterium]|nr:diaminopimelate epimerase [Desulfobulbaceae bacterium]